MTDRPATPQPTQDKMKPTAKAKPEAYDLDDPREVLRLYRECLGYLQTCHYKHGTDWDGRKFAMDALQKLFDRAATPQPNPLIAERMTAYVAHDHDKAWNALWDRCEQAEASFAARDALIAQMREALRHAIALMGGSGLCCHGNACIRNGKPERDDACRRRDLRDCLRAALSPQSVSNP